VPEERGHGVLTSWFFDSAHAGCKTTRQWHTGVILFVNKAPVMWYSKHQNTMETSTFGSEFCTLKTAIDMINGLQYKLQMMGIPVNGPTSVFCDNKSVVKNSHLSTLWGGEGDSTHKEGTVTSLPSVGKGLMM
jgi:hypothetical protein